MNLDGFSRWLRLQGDDHEFSEHPMERYVRTQLEKRWFVKSRARGIHPELYDRLCLTHQAGVPWTARNVEVEIGDLFNA